MPFLFLPRRTYYSVILSGTEWSRTFGNAVAVTEARDACIEAGSFLPYVPQLL